jgi:DNA-binding Lrp family transcriptional regulator
MEGRVLALDTVLSAMSHFVRVWSPELTRTQSRDLLRFLLCRLYDTGRGKLVGTQLTLAQGTLARKLGLSRQWVGILLERLRDAGWIEFAAPVLDDGMRGSTIFRVGCQLKRLLIMLLKSKRRKTPAKSDANKAWQFSPSKEEKRHLQILEQENIPPKPEVLKRIPLLRQWLERGSILERTDSPQT